MAYTVGFAKIEELSRKEEEARQKKATMREMNEAKLLERGIAQSREASQKES